MEKELGKSPPLCYSNYGITVSSNIVKSICSQKFWLECVGNLKSNSYRFIINAELYSTVISMKIVHRNLVSSCTSLIKSKCELLL